MLIEDVDRRRRAAHRQEVEGLRVGFARHSGEGGIAEQDIDDARAPVDPQGGGSPPEAAAEATSRLED